MAARGGGCQAHTKPEEMAARSTSERARRQAGRQRPAGSGQRRSDSGGCGQPPRGDEPPPGSRRKAPPFSAKSALPQRLARGPMTNCVRCTASGRSNPSLSLASLLCLSVRLRLRLRLGLGLRLPRCEPATACISHRIGSSYDRAKTGMWTPGHAMMRQSSPLPTMYVAALLLRA